MDTTFIPSPLDEATRLETAITKTATFAGTGFDLGGAPAHPGVGQPMAAVVKVTAVDHTTGDETYTATLKDSADGSSWSAIGPTITIDPTQTSKLTVPGFRTRRYVAVALVLGGTTPSITYDAWLTTQGFPRG